MALFICPTQRLHLGLWLILLPARHCSPQGWWPSRLVASRQRGRILHGKVFCQKLMVRSVLKARSNSEEKPVIWHTLCVSLTHSGLALHTLHCCQDAPGCVLGGSHKEQSCKGWGSTRWARGTCHTELARDWGDSPLSQHLMLENCSTTGLAQPWKPLILISLLFIVRGRTQAVCTETFRKFHGNMSCS